MRNIASNPLPYALALAGAFIWAVYATVTPVMSDGYDGTTIFFCCVAAVLWVIHFASGQGWPTSTPSISGYAALAACALSIAGGYACWGYGMLHGNMETLAVGSYATPVFSHRIQHGAARCGFGRAILDWRGAGGGGVADQSVVRAACQLAISPHVRFSRIRQSDWFVRCMNVRFW